MRRFIGLVLVAVLVAGCGEDKTPNTNPAPQPAPDQNKPAQPGKQGENPGFS